jgi:(p)ppGpp synthase/HD superfamily hydrolase
MLTKQYYEALAFASGLHHGHMRKGTEIDYLSHLLSVSALVMEHGGSEQEAIAGLLHDALEDQGDAYRSGFHGKPKRGRESLKRDLVLLFGERVRGIVVACTDDEDYAPGHKSRHKSVAAWRERKERYLSKLRKTTDAGILRVSNADKLHNARAILGDYEVGGERFWKRFAPKVKSDHLWYYESLVEIFTERAKALRNSENARMAKELRVVVERIRKHGAQRRS